MKPNKFTIEQGFYLIALVLAAVARIVILGRAALPDAEATLALQALRLIQGTAYVIGPHPGYLIPTALFDFFFGANNWTARLWPAISGVGLIAAVFILRERIGRSAALILAFLLALDPGLTAVSRQAGSIMPAISLTMLGLACLVERKVIWAGIFAGLALVSGPSLWPALVCIVVAWVFTYRNAEAVRLADPLPWVKIVLVALAAVGVMGTFFLFFPAALSAAAASLPAYLQSWGSMGGAPVLRMVESLAAYEILGLVLGLAGLVRGLLRGERLEAFLGIWWLLALILTLANPSRQVLDLAWSVIPMLVLAARCLDYLTSLQDEILATLGQGGVILLLLLLIGNLIISWPSGDSSPQNLMYRVLVMCVALLLIIAESFLVTWGWSRRVGLFGLAFGVTGFLLVFSFSTLGNAAGWSGRTPAELWRSGPSFPSADLLEMTLKNHTDWRDDKGHSPEIVILNLPSPALEWLFRDYPAARIEKSLPATARPEFVITADQSKIDLAAAYTGQAFDVVRSPVWERMSLADWTDWLVYRTVNPEVWQKELAVFWVRSDLFPGIQTNPTP